MKLDFSHTRIIIKPGTTNMQYSRDQLLEIVKSIMKEDPFSGAVFLFCNRSRKILKMIWWDRTGFWVAQKRLEKERWPWPDTQKQVRQLNMDQIEMLLKGVDFFKGHEELHFSEIN
jgi:transposase